MSGPIPSSPLKDIAPTIQSVLLSLTIKFPISINHSHQQIGGYFSHLFKKSLNPLPSPATLLFLFLFATELGRVVCSHCLSHSFSPIFLLNSLLIGFCLPHSNETDGDRHQLVKLILNSQFSPDLSI